MKTLLIIRHAKSSWEFGVADFDRSLNDRGKKDAPEMAKQLLDKKISIDAFVSSPAKRAKQTAELFCTAYKRNTKEIIFEESLYHSPAKNLFKAVGNLDNQFSTVAIFSHNTGLTNFVNQLVDGVVIDNVPTCGIFAITIAIDKWKDFDKEKRVLLFFRYPKLIND